MRRVLRFAMAITMAASGARAAPADPARAASGLGAATECRGLNMQPLAHLTWTAAATAGTRQQVEVTPRSDGFGDAERSRDLPPTAAAFDWRRVHGKGMHYWRVLTRHGDDWVPSEVASFEGIECILVPPIPPLSPGGKPVDK